MIPKVIHYCWFGKSPLPEKAVECIESWKRFCPDYEIIQWNEENYDFSKNQYVKDAYKEKKWAFVSDYARVDIIYNMGGIYLDTDVELIASLDDFLSDKLFCGWENRDPLLDVIGQEYENSVSFGLGFGSEAGHPLLKKILDIYENLSFYNIDGSLNLTACPKYQTDALKTFGLDTTQRTFQKLQDIVVYPEDCFSPKSILTGKIDITENTVAIHHFSMSWVDKESKIIHNLEWKLCSIMSYKQAKKIVKLISIPLRLKRKIRYILQNNS